MGSKRNGSMGWELLGKRWRLDNQSSSLGYEVGTIPIVGAITVWTDENGGYGHVAYVTDVATDGQIQVTESNYNGSYYPSNIRGFFDPTKTSEGKVSYIYPPAGV